MPGGFVPRSLRMPGYQQRYHVFDSLVVGGLDFGLFCLLYLLFMNLGHKDQMFY